MTLLGRRCFLSKITAGNSREKAEAQKQAVNFICQGSAADIVKVAMFNGHPVNTNGSNIVDSMDGLTQRNRKSEGVVTFFYRCMMDFCLKLTRLW